MAAQKKYPKLPNGFGSISKLSGNRKNPFAVYPPADREGTRPKALCYVSDYYVGVAVLNAYKAGSYVPGEEIQFVAMKTAPDFQYDELMKRMIRDLSVISESQNNFLKYQPTLLEVHNEWLKRRDGEMPKSYKPAFKRLESLYNKPLCSITRAEVQEIIDQQKYKSAPEFIKNYLSNIYKYALKCEYVEKNIVPMLEVKLSKRKPKKPYKPEDIEKLWKHTDNFVADIVLITIYTGIRISEFKTMELHLDEGYMIGGVKTEAGKNRIVPIHSGIAHIVEKVSKGNHFVEFRDDHFNDRMKTLFRKIDIEYQYTTHCGRHTFASMCERYGINQADQKRIMGHVLKDVTSGVYGHRTVDDLRAEIEKIQIC